MHTSHLQSRASRVNELLVQGHTSDLKPEIKVPAVPPALCAVVMNDLCIRRCRAQPNNVTPVNISDEKCPHYFF